MLLSSNSIFNNILTIIILPLTEKIQRHKFFSKQRIQNRAGKRAKEIEKRKHKNFRRNGREGERVKMRFHKSIVVFRKEGVSIQNKIGKKRKKKTKNRKKSKFLTRKSQIFCQ